MHPAILYPRRSQSRPQLVYSSAPLLYAIGRRRVRHTAMSAILSACPRTLKRALYRSALYIGRLPRAIRAG